MGRRGGVWSYVEGLNLGIGGVLGRGICGHGRWGLSLQLVVVWVIQFCVQIRLAMEGEISGGGEGLAVIDRLLVGCEGTGACGLMWIETR